MDFTFQFLPAALVWISALVSIVVLALIALRVDWQKNRSKGVLTLWFVSIFFLAVGWMIRADIGDEYNIHLLGIMLFALMFGWRLGVLGMAIVCMLVCLWGNMFWANLPLAILINALFGVSFSYLIFLLIEYMLPHNLYIYLYLSAFFGSAIAYSLTGTVSVFFLWWLDVQTWSTLMNEYLPFLYLMSFSESFLTCGLLTMFVVYKPEWVFSFRDERYLRGK